MPPQRGITNFTAGLAQLVAKDGIRVNAVAPGPVWTPLIPSTMSADEAANFGADSPLGPSRSRRKLLLLTCFWHRTMPVASVARCYPLQEEALSMNRGHGETDPESEDSPQEGHHDND
jgi:NAD(P)-dependent dehydrogenase (short-subunit alcohol dehydrogenase family)